jgi:CheY-like chemotaxis protein
MRFVPIVMWSGSVDPGDLRRAYDAGVTSYLEKPSTAAQAQEMLHATMHYWLRLHCPPD